MVLRRYLRPLNHENIDCLILGCTHYGLIKKIIKKIIGPNVKVISQGEIVAAKLKDYLKRHPEIETKLVKRRKREYFFTDYSIRYQKLAEFFLGKKIPLDKIFRSPVF